MADFNLLEQVLEKFAELGISAKVDWSAHSLGAENASTGWYAVSYAAPVEIEAPLFTKGAERIIAGSGIALKSDALALTKQATTPGDKVTDKLGGVWQVQTIRRHNVGDLLLFYELDLIKMESF